MLLILCSSPAGEHKVANKKAPVNAIETDRGEGI